MKLGQRLRQARLDAGLSQRQLCGNEITRNMLSQIENGTARPSMDTLRYLAARLEKPVSFFLEENAVLSENQQVMAQARQAYEDGEYGKTLAILKEYRAPDPVFDAEAHLLRLLALLALAEAVAEENRLPYAVQLLEQARQDAAATPYFTKELERRLLLLQALVNPDLRDSLLSRLPVDDRALLLRAEAALDKKDFTRCAALLDAAEDRTSRWAYLRGEASFGMAQYAEAAEYFRQAEADMPAVAAARLEQCYLQLGDYKMAYLYACKQRP